MENNTYKIVMVGHRSSNARALSESGGSGDAGAEVMTAADVRALAEREARSILNVSTPEAFQMLDRGDLAGTAAEAEFRMLRFLLDE